MKLIRLNPDASRDELEALYLIEAKQPLIDELLNLISKRPKSGHDKLRAKYLEEAKDSFVDEALRRAFDNDLARVEEPPKRRPRSKAAITNAAALIAERIRTMVLGDHILSCGEHLHDCNVQELQDEGGWYVRIIERVGVDYAGAVGETLGEQDYRDARNAVA
jgi:hypothetical protein